MLMTLSPYLTIRTPLFNSFHISIADTRTFKNIEFEQDQEIPILDVLIKRHLNTSFFHFHLPKWDSFTQWKYTQWEYKIFYRISS